MAVEILAPKNLFTLAEARDRVEAHRLLQEMFRDMIADLAPQRTLAGSNSEMSQSAVAAGLWSRQI